MLCVNAEIKELYTNLISEKAIEVLDQTDIISTCGLKVPFIKNRDNTGLCPVENLSLNVESIDDLLIGIDEFLKSIK